MDPEAVVPLLLHRPPLIGVVDHCGEPAQRFRSGGWSAALFIIGVEIAERFAYCGISLNLITYLTDQLGEPTAAAATAVNAWNGASAMMPLLGAFTADLFLGRYRTIGLASVIYILALGMLTLSSLLPSIITETCPSSSKGRFTACPPSKFQQYTFYLSLYLVAFAQGGHKPCTQAFGADQFDSNDHEECKAKSSFFNWWYFGINMGVLVSLLGLTYIQDNISWVLGFGIPCIAMAIALIIFFFGTKKYRYYALEEQSPFIRIGIGLRTMIRRQSTKESKESSEHGSDYSLVLNDTGVDREDVDGNDDVHNQVEEAKGVLRLIPIWSSCLIFAVVCSQTSTFFTKQGSTLDRRVALLNFQVPPAALMSFTCLTIVAFLPIYDRLLVPIYHKFSSSSSGISMLQRIGTGILIQVISIAIAAVVETKRLKIAADFGLTDSPEAILPMSMWWLVPQYVLNGVSDALSMVGLQEFYYDQVPDSVRSLGLALYLSILGIGNYLSSLLVFVIDKATAGRDGDGQSWFSNNLNVAHLDYFYWLLAALDVLGFVLYLFCAKIYVYKKKQSK